MRSRATTLLRRGRAAFLLVPALLLAMGCGGDDDAEEDGGAAPGEACDSEAQCPVEASFCFAVGEYSSCRSGGLCVGDGSGLSCSAACDGDADCASEATATACLQGCAEPLFNGFCVDPSVRDDLLTWEFCETPGERSRGIGGSSL